MSPQILRPSLCLWEQNQAKYLFEKGHFEENGNSVH